MSTLPATDVDHATARRNRVLRFDEVEHPRHEVERVAREVAISKLSCRSQQRRLFVRSWSICSERSEAFDVTLNSLDEISNGINPQSLEERGGRKVDQIPRFPFSNRNLADEDGKF